MTNRYIIEDQERKDNVIKDYINDVSIESLRRIYKIGHVLIRRYLGDIYDPNRGERLSKENLFRRVNHNPFENLEDNQVQYWLGMIASDGCLRQDGDLALSQSEKDHKHMIEYCKFLKLEEEPKLRYNKKYKSYMSSVDFCNYRVVQYLKSIGITERKSFTLDIKFNFNWHFVRGILDGDGYIGFFYRTGKKKKTLCHIDIATASKVFANQLKIFIERFEILVKIYKYDSRAVYIIRIGNFVNCKKFLEFLYQDADIYLERKYQSAQLIRNYETQTDLKLRELASKNPEASKQNDGDLI